MSSGNLASLYEIAFDGAVPTVCGDARETRDWAEENGCRYIPLETAVQSPSDLAIIVCATNQWYRQLNSVREAFASSRVLWIPFAAFHGEGESLKYGLRGLSELDFRSAKDRQYAVTDVVVPGGNVTVTDRDGNAAEFIIPFGTRVSEAPRRALSNGEFISLLSYFEVETEYTAPNCAPLQGGGQLNVRCVLNAAGPSNRSRAEQRAGASDLCSRAGSASKTVLDIRDGSLIGLIADGEDFTSEIARLTGERLGLRITELSFGLNDQLSRPDWTLNSPLNEGVVGVHLGVGDGYSGLHFDFVCPSAQFDFADA
jgi:hypothetical protein